MKYKTTPLKLPKVRDAGSLTPAEAATAAGVSLSTIWRRIRTGELASYKVGNDRLIPADAVKPTQQDDPHAVWTLDHPFWKLVGSVKGGGDGPGSSDKYFYLTGVRKRAR